MLVRWLKRKQIIPLFFGTILLFASLFINAQIVSAFDIKDNTGLQTAADKAYGNSASIPFSDSGSVSGVAGLVGQIIGVVLAFLGAIFLILIIYAGFLWMTARGNEQQVTKSKGIMRDAIIGLIIVLAAYAITAFVGRILAPTTS